MTTATSVRESPILFSGEMVRAILDGRKTQTRRVVKPQPSLDHSVTGPMWGHRDLGGFFADHVFGSCAAKLLPCPYGQPDDRLWVRETWGLVNNDGYAVTPSTLCYRADGAHRLVKPAELLATDPLILPRPGWRPSIHMPRWASRITLAITDVRVERLQAISVDDIEAEGVYRVKHSTDDEIDTRENLASFADLWDSLNADRGFSFEANPWVWVVSFRTVEEIQG